MNVKKPLILAVVNEKGGVGKSTFAAHLAVWCHESGLKTALLDADGQASTTRWIQEAEPGMTNVHAFEPDPIYEAIDELSMDHQVIVCDGPGNMAESTRALMMFADAILVPVGPSQLEVEATKKTARILKNAELLRSKMGGGPKPLLVLTRLRNAKYKLTGDVKEVAPELGLPVAKATLSFSDIVADSPGQGTVLWRMGGRARKYAKEMINILEEFIDYATGKDQSEGPTIEPSDGELHRYRVSGIRRGHRQEDGGRRTADEGKTVKGRQDVKQRTAANG